MIISTCNQKHIDGYDTMYPCSEFEFEDFPDDIFLSKNTEKTYKNAKNY